MQQNGQQQSSGRQRAAAAVAGSRTRAGGCARSPRTCATPPPACGARIPSRPAQMADAPPNACAISSGRCRRRVPTIAVARLATCSSRRVSSPTRSGARERGRSDEPGTGGRRRAPAAGGRAGAAGRPRRALQDNVERMSRSGQGEADERRATEDAARELERQKVPSACGSRRRRAAAGGSRAAGRAAKTSRRRSIASPSGWAPPAAPRTPTRAAVGSAGQDAGAARQDAGSRSQHRAAAARSAAGTAPHSPDNRASQTPQGQQQGQQRQASDSVSRDGAPSKGSRQRGRAAAAVEWPDRVLDRRQRQRGSSSCSAK